VAALRAEEEAIARDGQDPSPWYTLGSLRFLRDDFTGAGVAYRQALRRNPWSFFGLAGSYRAALERHDTAAARAWRSKLCRLGTTYCPPASELVTGHVEGGPSR
jgi:cytochrome c-type biogenesis protein CcmH/NrfG